MKLQESMTGFYYVGINQSNITKFVNIYNRGYASGNLNEAMTEILKKEHIKPEVICCESSFGFEAINQWADLLSKNERLSKVPLIIDADSTTTVENYHFMRNKMVDDILHLEEWDECNLNTKIRFLQKFKTRSRELEDHKKIADVISSVPKSMDSFLKRAFNFLISLAALMLLSPLFILIALAIRIESKGNIFYISKRAGKGYRIFNFYKFRTMFPDADKSRTQYVHLNLYPLSELTRFFKVENDPRITRVGRFLRNTSLDELPQLFNVLLGDMSLVGNRPLPLYEAENLTTDTLAKRFMAPAGMTGLWQVKKRGNPVMSEDERIGLDLNYAEKSNLLMDMWIMARTPQALIQKTNT
jgi:lipopolysaccharide/colanic/teichoic acid biosynthesis glycosyltransferase